MKRIIIIGCPGSGKTTLAKRLSERMQLPLVHLDTLGWHGNWEQTSNDEFDRLLMNELAKPEWIIEGNYNRTIPTRLIRCDTVIYLDFSRFACLCGVIGRVIKGYGKSRPDMGGNCPERFDLDFLKFVWGFNKQHRKNYYDALLNEKDKNIIILRNRKEADKLLSEI